MEPAEPFDRSESMRLHVSDVVTFMADLMTSFHGQIVLLIFGAIGILMLRGPSGRI
jgi:ABC-type transport system involved in cytochrome c biogenesis permease subunit